MNKKVIPKSFHLQWHITERCNLKCKHCYFEPKFLKDELKFEQMLGIFEQYIELIERWDLPLNSARASITGGEPFVSKYLLHLIKKFYNYRDETQYGILTNGTIVDRKVAHKLKALQVDYVQVSLEGMEKVNDSIRGKQSFARALNGIRHLIDAGVTVGISMTLSKINLQEVPKLIKFCEEIGVSLGIRRLVPIGRGMAMKSLMLSPLEVKRIYDYIYKKELQLKKRKSGLHISMGCEDGILAQNWHYLPAGCSAGYTSLTVLPNGEVYPCRRLPITLGNALKDSLWDIYYKSEEIKEIRNLNNASDKCRGCPFFAECHGGAKCISYGYFGTLSQPDPQCWRLYKELPNKPEPVRKAKGVYLDRKLIRVLE